MSQNVKKPQKTTTINGDWVADLVGSIGQYIFFETKDGVSRNGRLTCIHTRDFLWNGKKVSLPFEIELNGDVYDSVPIDRLTKLGLVELP